ncbi:hypothetical protein F5Y15DRAFT_150772 [Xylariaceae sp. FL0016]|nr:hypothetical protein F5Y15DRAFT_150772 [Xylariaceae sp. FL0016]
MYALRTKLQAFRAPRAACANTLATPISSILFWYHEMKLNRAIDTKEKPYVCRCGSAFSRRDLLTRHQRISHETQDGASGSPDAPVSDEGLNASNEPEISGGAGASSLAALVTDRGAQHAPYMSSGRDLGVTASQAYHQYAPSQDLYSHGQPYAGFDHYSDFSGYSDGASLPPEWSPYLNDRSSDQEMVDPALRGSIADPSSPVVAGDYSAHPYNPWMSAHQQWGN